MTLKGRWASARAWWKSRELPRAVFWSTVTVVIVITVLWYLFDRLSNGKAWPALESSSWTVLPDSAEQVSSQSAVYLTLIFVSFLFVLINTFNYAIEMVTGAGATDKGAAHLGQYKTLAKMLWGATTVIAIWLFVIYQIGAEEWHEWVAIVVFSVFILFDCWLASLQRREGSTRYQILSQWSIFQALVVDIPVVFGLLGVVILVKTQCIPEHYEWAFLAGSIAMHLFASQLIFVVLRVHFAWRLDKEAALLPGAEGANKEGIEEGGVDEIA